MKSNINILDTKLQEFAKTVGQLQGEFNLLQTQQTRSKDLIIELEQNELKSTKAVELLTKVQAVTREKIKDGFESIVTHALNYIFESDKYSFHLVFSKRGNLQELNFAVQTPDKAEPLDPLTTDAGGILNIISFALRVVLMEVATPKINGFIISDESFANLSENHVEKASQFLKELTQKLKRQIICISHQQKIIDSADKLIQIKND